MPELPEVETLRRQLQNAIKGKTIKSAESDWYKMVKPLSIPEFQKQIRNKKIIGISRRAKVLVLDLADPPALKLRRASPLSLLIHLKLTGQLIFRGKKQEARSKLVVGGHPQPGGLDSLPNKFTHLILNFTDGSTLFFNDLRKFGWARLVGDDGVAKVIEEMGPEPLTKSFTLEYLRSIIKKYQNRKIKQILMDQKLIGGIGNIYCDESCFCAKIMPTRIAKKLKPDEIKKLYQCVNQVIKFAIAKKGTSADTYVQLSGKPGGMVPYLKVYGREGEKCKRCGGKVEWMKLNGRGTHFCRKCQR